MSANKICTYLDLAARQLLFALVAGTAAVMMVAPAIAQDSQPAHEYKATAFPLGGEDAVSVGPLESSAYSGQHLLGDWDGIQPWLTKRGIFLSIGLNEEYFGNFTGGRTRDAVLAGQVAVGLDIDWRKLAGVSGLWTHMLVVNGHGRSFSQTLGDSLTNPEQIYGARGNVVAHLVALWADKTLFNDRMIASIGWIPTGHFFNFDSLGCAFVNVTVCGNDVPGKYLPGGRDWPSGNVGGVLRVLPTKRTYIMGGIFGVTQASYNGGISGWSWAQKMSGVSTNFEVGWNPAFGRDKLLGHYKIGGYYDSSRYVNLYEDINGNSFQETGLARRYQSGTWVGWLMFNQMLLRNGPGVSNGLIVIGGAAYASGTVSAMRDHEYIGLLETGSIWGRPSDQIGAMFQRIDVSHTLRLQQESSLALGQSFLSNQWGSVYGVQDWEQIYEGFYSFHLATATAIQLDFQYLQHPGATTRFHDAAILGGQFTTSF